MSQRRCSQLCGAGGRWSAVGDDRVEWPKADARLCYVACASLSEADAIAELIRRQRGPEAVAEPPRLATRSRWALLVAWLPAGLVAGIIDALQVAGTAGLLIVLPGGGDLEVHTVGGGPARRVLLTKRLFPMLVGPMEAFTGQLVLEADLAPWPRPSIGDFVGVLSEWASNCLVRAGHSLSVGTVQRLERRRDEPFPRDAYGLLGDLGIDRGGGAAGFKRLHGAHWYGLDSPWVQLPREILDLRRQRWVASRIGRGGLAEAAAADNRMGVWETDGAGGSTAGPLWVGDHATVREWIDEHVVQPRSQATVLDGRRFWADHTHPAFPPRPEQHWRRLIQVADNGALSSLIVSRPTQSSVFAAGQPMYARRSMMNPARDQGGPAVHLLGLDLLPRRTLAEQLMAATILGEPGHTEPWRPIPALVPGTFAATIDYVTTRSAHPTSG